MTSSQRYSDWKAPAGDGQTLLWPDPEILLRETLANQKRLSKCETAKIQNLPLTQLRSSQRKWLGHDDAKPLVATGHQAELHHPGVWAKNALIHAIAKKLDGQAYHFAVDTDAPKHLSLRWPGGSEPIVDVPQLATASWSGLLDSPSPRHLKQVESAFNAAAKTWSFSPIIGNFFDSMRKTALEQTNLDAALINSVHKLDWDLGLRHHAMIVSPIFSSEPYLIFVHHILSRAAKFAADYNASLAEYRAENGIKSPGRPMPDLAVANDRCEVPFWLDSLSRATRKRATVELKNGKAILHNDDGEPFTFDENAPADVAARSLIQWLRVHELRLSPRALTLTIFLRLLVADQFVHGIGGGRYDQVADRLIQKHFGIDPPSFSVTTATLFFPDAVDKPRACLPCVLLEGHRLRHSLLGERKRELVTAIESSPRYSPRRAELFTQMHRELNVALGADPKIVRWQEKLATTEKDARDDKILFDRELFYAIQTRERLSALIAKYESAFL